MSKVYLGNQKIGSVYVGSSFQGRMEMYEDPYVKNPYTWDAVIANCASGKYASIYRIGDTIPLDLGSEGIVNMEIVGIDVDELADGSGVAPLTWISKELLGTSKRMNPELVTNDDGTYQEGTGTIGGWSKTEMHTYMNGTVKNLIPENVRTGIKTVNKTYYGYKNSTSSSGTSFRDVCADDCWIPSYREIFGGTSCENSGPIYSAVFNSAETRKKTKYNSSSTSRWWLRSANNASGFRYVTVSGYYSSSIAYDSNGVALGFCT